MVKLFDNLSNAWNALIGKSGGPPGAYYGSWGGGPIWSDIFRSRRAPAPAELVEAYTALVYACVQLNANGVARVPLRLYATTKGGQARPKHCGLAGVSTRARHRLKSLDYTAKAVAHAEEVEEVTDHPILSAVTKVNEHLDHIQLLFATVMDLDLNGDSYWWPDMGPMSLPKELWALPAYLVWPQFLTGSLVPDVYQFGSHQYKANELIRFRWTSAKNFYGKGYGPNQASIEYSRLERVFTNICENMVSNGPRPSLLVSHKDPKGNFGAAERKRLEFDLDQKTRGGRAGAVVVVDGAAAVTPLSYNPSDLAGLQISQYDLERIANCFGVPISLLQSKDVNRANAEAGQIQHARDAIEPRCKRIASTLTRWVHSLDPKGVRGWDRLFWAFDSPIKDDAAAEAAYLKTLIDMGAITRNEARLELGYEPIDGADDLMVSNALVPLGLPKPNEPLPAARADEELNDGNELDEEEEETEAGATTEPAEDEDESGKTKALSEAAVLARVATLIPRLEAQLTRDERLHP